MSNSRVMRSVAHGFGANAYSQVVTVVVQLVGVPILLRAWGVELYGEWLLLFAVPAALSMTDLGFSHSAANDMTALVRRGNQTKALEVFQSLALLIYCVSVLALLLVSVLVWFLPLDRLLNIHALSLHECQWILLFFSAEIIACLLSGMLSAGFRATGDYALIGLLEANIRLLQMAGVWCAALYGEGLVIAAVAPLIVRLGSLPPIMFFLKKRRPWISYGVQQAKREELKRLYKPAIANMAHTLTQAANIQGLVIVVGSILGSIAVVAFSTLRTLSRLIVQLTSALIHAVEPEIAASFGGGDKALTRALITHSLRVGFWLALSSAIVLILFGQYILDIWTHGKVGMDSTLFFMLLASAVLSSLWYGIFSAQKAANMHMKSSAVLVIVSLVSLLVALVSMRWTGDASGAGLSVLLIDCVMILYSAGRASELFGFSIYGTLLQAVNPFPMLSVIAKERNFG